MKKSASAYENFQLSGSYPNLHKVRKRAATRDQGDLRMHLRMAVLFSDIFRTFWFCFFCFLFFQNFKISTPWCNAQV